MSRHRTGSTLSRDPEKYRDPDLLKVKFVDNVLTLASIYRRQIGILNILIKNIFLLNISKNFAIEHNQIPSNQVTVNHFFTFRKKKLDFFFYFLAT